jgi:hypothetical protein
MLIVMMTHTSLSHTKESKIPRRLSEEEMAVAWLNAAQGTPSYRRVFAVYKALEEQIENYKAYAAEIQSDSRRAVDAARAMAAVPLKDRVPPHPASGAVLNRLRKRGNELNQALSRYSLTPQVVSWNGHGLHHNMFSRTRRSGFSLPFGDPRHGLSITEETVVMCLLHVAELGNLRRVRLCEYCREKWRVSMRGIDRFCGDKCRIAFNTGTPEAKKRHLAAQKRYRRSLGYRKALAREMNGRPILRKLGR